MTVAGYRYVVPKSTPRARSKTVSRAAEAERSSKSMRGRFWAKKDPDDVRQSSASREEIERPSATAFELQSEDGSSMGIYDNIVSGKRALDFSLEGKRLIRCDDGVVIAERKTANEMSMRHMRG